ncbi:MAG: hypothetical protein IJE89_02140 [Bacilli bacterium]|nr:hypothetical protein [Bacilli bacterium]
MTKNNNFKWLTSDIDKTLILKVVYKNGDLQEEYGVFNISDVLETTGDELEVETANIDDLTKFLTLGIVRFTNVSDDSDILDIPFRNLYQLYKNANMLGEESEQKLIPFSDLDTFSVIDGTVRNDLLVFSATISEVSEDLEQVMKIAYEYNNYGMQDKFDALSKITLINHRRLISDEKERILK